MHKNFIKYGVIFICIPAIVALGIFVFDSRQNIFISLCAAVAACIPFFITFEKKDTNTRKMVIIAVMTTLSVAGRSIFYILPGFKPVTAIVVITALFFGSEAGFLTGALSAIVSNIFFGQGPWTPFQMFAWGMIGFLAGILSKQLKSSKILLCVYGIFAGVAFSLILNAWTALWVNNVFNFNLYLAAFVTGLPATLTYAVSNVIFLLFLTKPIGAKLERVRVKYGL